MKDHKFLRDILSEDHPASVKHRGEAAKGYGGLATDQSHGYEEASRHEEFKHGGWTSHEHHEGHGGHHDGHGKYRHGGGVSKKHK